MNGSDTGGLLVRHAAAIAWSPSPGGEVERKRFHHVGAPESGIVTSLVRYRPGARFPAHAHPQGEEILVLEGVFSDLTGDYPAGTHLLNPEGFMHAPWSDPGCLLFVKLRQYAGGRRAQQILRTDRLPWQAGAMGCEELLLQDDPAHGDVRRMVRCAAGQHWRPESAGAEVFVVSGAWQCDGLRLAAHDWLRVAAGTEATLTCAEDGTLYVCTWPGEKDGSL